MTTCEEILAAAEALTKEERLVVVDSLLQSINPPEPAVDAMWAPIIKRRIEEIDRGEVRMIPGEEALAEARRRILDR